MGLGLREVSLLGDVADPEAGKALMAYGARLFRAPVVVFLCMDQGVNSNFDIGMLAQTICLAAQGYGVDSMIAAAFVSQPDILHQVLEIPEQLNPVIGVGLGYACPESIINTYRSPRRPIQEVVRYKN